jgi:hypothetical protein
MNTTNNNKNLSEDKIKEVLGNLAGIGLQGLGKMIGIILLLGFINLMFVAFATSNAIWGDELTKLTWQIVGIIFLVSVVFTAFCAYKMYQYTIIRSAEKVYDMIKEVVIKGLCVKIVVQVITMKSESQSLPTKEKFKTMFNLVTLVGDKLNTLPSIIKKPLLKIISTIPFYGLVTEYWTLFENNNKEEITELLYKKANELVKEELLHTNLVWLLWLIPINILVQFLVIFIG